MAVRIGVTAVRWVEEIECGRRPADHLRALLRPGLAARWSLDARLPRQPGRVRSAGRVQLQRFGGPPRCELVVLVERDGRVLPVALRLVAERGRWTVSELERPGAPDPSPVPASWVTMLETT